MAEKTIALFDVLTRELIRCPSFPFRVSAAQDSDLVVPSASQREGFVVLRKGRRTAIMPCFEGGNVLLDGTHSTGEDIQGSKDYSVIVGDRFFGLRMTSDPEVWANSINTDSWSVYQKEAGKVIPGLRPTDVVSVVEEFQGGADGQILFPSGFQMGFYAHQILPEFIRQFSISLAGITSNLQGTVDQGQDAKNFEREIDLEYGDFTCPVCWLKFDAGDVMSIAMHDSLRGDVVLGEEAMQRFWATRFNDRGQALDAKGIPTSDIACPHCRRKLPTGFLQVPHYIFSIVGAPSSGKSYYLSVLIKQLQVSLFKHFQVTFRDADPTANALLNSMKNNLFSASTPQEAFLIKTGLDGDMYEQLPRLGKKVPLPKPFIFNISQNEKRQEDFSIVFYDNAGEHFEPGINASDSPGAQHIAAASGIFFLFDPIHSTEFKSKLGNIEDPQLKVHRLDQQDILLAETEVRLKALVGLGAQDRVGTPMAVLIGKYDTWRHLLPPEEIPSPVVNGKLDLDILNRNSETIKSLLMDVHPSIVANAEAISRNVRYFAISALGCSPVEFTDSKGEIKVGPDPKNVRPVWVEIPTLWVLSCCVPDVITCTGGRK